MTMLHSTSHAAKNLTDVRKTRRMPLMFAFGIVLAVFMALSAPDGMSACSPARARVDVPFAFMIGDTELPAGRYEIGEVSNSGAVAISLRNLDTGRASLFQTRSLTGTASPQTLQAEFVTAENRRYLTRMWTTFGTPGLEIVAQPSVKVVREQLRLRKNPVLVRAR